MFPLCLIKNLLPYNFSLHESEPHVRFKLAVDRQMKNNEIDFLILHIENHTKCDIVNHWLDANREILNVIFKSTKGLRYLPSISHYLITGTLNTINDNSYFRRNERILIITNVTKHTEQYLTIFIKNLVPGNSIVQYFESKIISNTYIVEFKNRINYDQLKKRNADKEILTRQRFHLMPAFHTNAVILKYRIKQLNSVNGSSFNKSGIFSKMDSVYVFKFKSQLGRIATTVSQVEGLENSDFELYENCYNLDLVASKVGEIDDKLLRKLIEEQEGILNHFFSQYFPVGFLVWIYVLFLLNYFRQYFKK